MTNNDATLTHIIAVSVQKTLWPTPELVLSPACWFLKIIHIDVEYSSVINNLCQSLITYV